MVRSLTTFAMLLALFLSASTAIAEGEKAFIDPNHTDEDFAFQGEYVGQLTEDGKQQKWGGQIIALGGGKFRAIGYPGGLPGNGWNEKDKKSAEGERNGDQVVCQNEEIRLVIEKGVMTVYDSGGAKLGQKTKVHRKSPTLGAKPPVGAIVLYDGPESIKHWKDTRVSEGDYLMQGATSKRQSQSFSVHLEFRLPYMPESRGQHRGNSGYYVQGRYEIQMLDSFGLEGLNDQCGGVYAASRPKVNMCYPPLSWQTYDVDFTAAEFKDGEKVKNARMTVRHNGVVIHDNADLPSDTPGGVSKEGPNPGAVFLQDHGNPVRYRNIWLVEKPKS